jgi:hypothetical protein
MTEFGEPNVDKTACYGSDGFRKTVGEDGTASFFGTCPVGYSTALTTTTKPFDEPRYASTKTETFDAVATHVMCCPSGHGYDFKYSEIRETTTRHDGRNYDVQLYIMPACVATRVKTLSGKDVTMGLFSDPRVWDKRDETPATTTTAAWDYEHDTLWAQERRFEYTVFHGTYSCYDGCEDYFTYSYHNTDPNAPPPTSAQSKETASGGSGEKGDDNSGAAAVGTARLWVFLAVAAVASLAVL